MGHTQLSNVADHGFQIIINERRCYKNMQIYSDITCCRPSVLTEFPANDMLLQYEHFCGGVLNIDVDILFLSVSKVFIQWPLVSGAKSLADI